MDSENCGGLNSKWVEVLVDIEPNPKAVTVGKIMPQRESEHQRLMSEATRQRRQAADLMMCNAAPSGIMVGATTCEIGEANLYLQQFSGTDIKQEEKKLKQKKKDLLKLKRKCLKSEAKAHELLKKMIGLDQWKVYRKTNRVIVKPGKHFWMIGDVFGSHDKKTPFAGKPAVVRIDNQKKLHVTSFCVVQDGGEQTPYTDKVVSFATHLVADEKGFVETVNRIDEKTFNTMKECAVWEVNK